MTQAAEFATADLADEHGTALQFCQAPLHQYGGRRAFCGPLATIRCFQDNALLKATLAEPGHGRVMVVDGGGSLSYALLGDMLGDSAVRNGWAGVVVNGAVRDTAVLRTLDLGVKALGAFPRRSAKTGAGERDVVVKFGSVVFTPGDRLFSDDDGIVLLPAAG